MFLSNFHFAEATGYFGAEAHELPLLHTWSLAVEEQFYLLFPLAILGMRRWTRRATGLALVAAGLVSLVLAETLARVDTEKNFFFTFSRVWELLAGALVALSPDRTSRTPILAWLGMALLVVPLFVPLPGAVPGLAILPPVAGTALVLRHAGPKTGVARLLSWVPLQKIGLISYSAYLWHQPVFALARAGSEQAPSGLRTAGLILIILALAAITWRLVEQPFRGIKPRLLPTRRGALTAAVVGSFGLLGFGLAGQATGGWAALWSLGNPELVRELGLVQTARDRPALTDNGCRFSSLDPLSEKVRARLEDCREAHGKGILVVGDSHGIDLYVHLTRLDRAPFIFAMVQGGCRPHSPDGECPFDALPLLAEDGFFEFAIYEQAGFYLMQTEAFPQGERAMIGTVGLADPVPDLAINAANVDGVKTYLEKLAQVVPVVWFGPRIEPHIPLVTLFDTGCGNPPFLRPGLVEAFERLDASIAATLQGSKIRYLSQNQLFDFRWPADFGSCDALFWRDGDHFSAAGGLRFGGRADVVAAARAILAVPASE